MKCVINELKAHYEKIYNLIHISLTFDFSINFDNFWFFSKNGHIFLLN